MGDSGISFPLCEIDGIATMFEAQISEIKIRISALYHELSPWYCIVLVDLSKKKALTQSGLCN